MQNQIENFKNCVFQEAEHRRITEQQQRNAVSRKSLPTNLAQNQQKQAKPSGQSEQTQTQQAWQYQQPHHQLVIHQVCIMGIVILMFSNDLDSQINKIDILF